MKAEVGKPYFPMWLLGDSNPTSWQDVLETPLDPRHPTRHNIWTPVLERMQDRLFREAHIRLDTSNLYIRNAIEDPDRKRELRGGEWSSLQRDIATLRKLVSRHQPQLLLTFGAFAFEFARRAVDTIDHSRSTNYWTTKRLGEEFRHRNAEFSPDKANVIPLLHASIARGKFLQAHDYFCGAEGSNYFDFTGEMLAGALLKFRTQFPAKMWIE